MAMGLQENAAKQLAAALESGEGIENAMAAAMEQVADRVADTVREEFAQHGAMAARACDGYRVLNAEEREFYGRMCDAAKTKQAFADFIGSNVMPDTVIDDVFRDLESGHRLLEVVNFQAGRYLTKLIRNKNGIKRAVWGKITAAVSEEITGSIDVLSVKQNKLSCYAIVPLDIIDMGPEFVDRLVRAELKEALCEGMEYGIIQGSGIDCPVGLIRDVHVGVTIDTTTGYPLKSAVKVTSLADEDYLDLISALAVNEFGRTRKFDRVYAIMGLPESLKWKNAVPRYFDGTKELGFPTEVIVSNEVPTGKAVLMIPDAYDAAVTGTRNGNIETSDEAKFLDDVRVFKLVTHADGIAIDNTAALYLDVSELRRYVNKVTEVQGNQARLEFYKFTVGTTEYAMAIDRVAKTGAVTVPNGTTITSIVGNFGLSDGASAKIGSTAQVSGTTSNSWTSGTAKNFVVTSEDGQTAETYALTITVAASA